MPFKYEINPDHDSGRDTLCQSLRHLYRRARAEARTEDMYDIAKCYDFAKRIVAKAQEHKAARGITGPLIRDGYPDAVD